MRLSQMHTTELLQKLFDIERSIGIENNTTIRNKIIDVEEWVLMMQRERAENLRSVSVLANCRS
jgi:hypothetical protein